MHAAKPTLAKSLQPSQIPLSAAADDTASRPDRRRGMSNFLTWSFFLAELWAADLFFGGDANATESLNDPGALPEDATAADGDAARLQPWQQDDPSLDPEAPAQNPSLSSPSLTPQGVAQAEPVSPSGAMDQPALGTVPGGGGASGHMLETATASDLAAGLDPSEASHLGIDLAPVDFELLPDMGGAALPVAEISLDLETLGLDLGVETGLLGGAALEVGFDGEPLSKLIDGMTGLNLGGTIDSLSGLLSPAADAEAPAPLVEAASEPAGVLYQGPAEHLFASDTITLGPITAGPEPDSLFAGGKYTDYNVSLQSDSDGGEARASATTDTDSSFSGSAIDVSIDDSASGSSVDLSVGDNDLLRGL